MMLVERNIYFLNGRLNNPYIAKAGISVNSEEFIIKSNVVLKTKFYSAVKKGVRKS